VKCSPDTCEWYRHPTTNAAHGQCMSPGVNSEEYLNRGRLVSYIGGKGRVWSDSCNECIGDYKPRQEVLPL